VKQWFSQHYDFSLILLTALILTGIGVVCLYGIAYYNYHYAPEWTETQGYAEYVDSMNLYLYPLVVLLLVVIGLCIPKRLVPREKLLGVSAVILTVTVLLALFSLTAGLGFLLGVMMLSQSLLLFFLALKRGRFYFERQGRVVEVGSTFLHLGIVVFIFDFAVLRDSNIHLAVFWLSAMLISAGCVLCFYPQHIRRIGLRITGN
jgi:hypothetical protein